MGQAIILLVEDNPDDEELTLLALKRGHLKTDVVVVRDGQEALDYVFCTGQHANRAKDVRIKVILLDISLPKINGLEVLRRIRADECTQWLPVVMLTSSNEERDRYAAYGGRANSYIRKPVDFDEFMSAVQQLGLYWININQPPPKAGVS